ncbi:MAG: toxin HicA [Gammaproteobacteria bacterium]|nr:toxin HicA [Gammaproteobacteria bacterium]
MEDRINTLIEKMKHNPKGVRFVELEKVCEHYFGAPRKSGGSHCIYKMPWSGDPRVNIQNSQGKAKAYQVKQVLQAIGKLKGASYER